MKAITASLLMESVLAPNFKFKRKDREDQKFSGAEIFVKGLKDPSTQRTKGIIENDMNDLRASILQEPRIQTAIAAGTDADVINKQMIPAIIKQIYPDLSGEEVEEVRQQFITQSVVQSAERKVGVGQTDFLKMADKFVNIDELSIDLIDSVNPFQRAYEVISREIDAPTLRLIQDYMDGKKMEFSEEELLILYPQIKQFHRENNRYPDKSSNDMYEQRLAYALLQLARMKRESDND